MPVYEYRCKTCGKTHEIEHGFNDERPTVCPECSGTLARVFHPVGVVFKGSGFHKNDYTKSGARSGVGDSSEAPAAASGDSAGGKKPEGAAASGQKASEGKSTESKSAPAKPADGKSTSSGSSEKKSPASGASSNSSGGKEKA
ncbi:MAG: FmdB family transcriptional regulator [Candidatus Eremiobacter antarcticus]|nr:FmdB family transcriptional regulator [Candidatus Eremiobacteraeota bacterium]MBC5807252.1 FmdB family transcriptional regulator [Candidatus Eremiobacteraeota bacterium]PZR61943.1 MAG: FmdB family transcriptional regulator [Candidatus Eremiobacter sp. RRmetagenome_bin22]